MLKIRIHSSVIFQIALILLLIAVPLGALPARAASTVDFGWARGMGGTSYDAGVGLALDGSGNVYITGNFSGTADFDPGLGTDNLTSAGQEDIFVSKLNSGGGLVWAKRIGGTGSDSGSGIVVDEAGNIYFTGNFSGAVDFDPGTGVNHLTSAGNYDVFVARFDTNGNLVWAKGLGGTSSDDAYRLTVDGSGSVFGTGYFSGTADFDPGLGVYNLTSQGGYDIFIFRLDHNGNLEWARNMGGTYDDSGSSLALDGSGNIYSTGGFWGTADFDPGPGISNLSSGGFRDIFISKLNENGEFVWAKRFGGTGSDSATDIEIGEDGSIYTTGEFNNTVDFDPGPGTSSLASQGYSDIFISRLGQDGNFVWARAVGGAAYSEGSHALELGADRNVHIVGAFAGTVDFDPGGGIHNLTSAGSSDAFISQLDSNGNFVWARRLGGPVYDFVWDLALDKFGQVYSTGVFSNVADFDPDLGTYNLTSAGYLDIFISKLSVPSTFSDVPFNHMFWRQIEAFFNAGITTGCSQNPMKYCPYANVTRAEMAVFLERAMGNFAPTPNTTGMFTDVPVDFWAASFIEELYNDGITTGCGVNPLRYCPNNNVTRQEMAVFIERALGNFAPTPNPTGMFADVPYPGMPVTFPAFIEQFYNDGITTGCANNPLRYCPLNNVTRQEMAVFIVRAFDIPLP